jgi:type II secretion system protein G
MLNGESALALNRGNTTDQRGQYMQRRAFTLIELLIVVAIIGILAAIAVPNFMNARVRAKVARVQSDLKAISTALEQYYMDWNSYVEDHDNDAGPFGFKRLTTPVAYMSGWPRDPFPSNYQENQVENMTYEFGSGDANVMNSTKQWPSNAYLIICSGPNLSEEVSGNDSFPWGPVYILEFDISNGVTSNGDIIRMGGEWHRGFIFMNGVSVAGH